jgi:hypothetical protein
MNLVPTTGLQFQVTPPSAVSVGTIAKVTATPPSCEALPTTWIWVPVQVTLRVMPEEVFGTVS